MALQGTHKYASAETTASSAYAHIVRGQLSRILLHVFKDKTRNL